MTFVASRGSISISSPGSSSSRTPVVASTRSSIELDELLGLVLAAVDEQPARALGHVAAHEQDGQAHDRAEPEGQPPAEVDARRGSRRAARRTARAGGGAEPEGAVDREVDPAARARGDQLVDRGVDRRVLAADAQAGEEAEDPEGGGAPRERGRDRGDQVDGERDHEQLLAPEAVGELAEEERPDGGAGDVARAAEGDLEGAEPERLLVLQAAGDRADDRDLEAVEDPDGAQPDDDQPVPAAPRQPVHAGRDARRDGLAGARCLHGHGLPAAPRRHAPGGPRRRVSRRRASSRLRSIARISCSSGSLESTSRTTPCTSRSSWPRSS